MAEKKWEKPEIVIVTRSTSEEYVLVNCKNNTSTPGGGPSSTDCHKSGSKWCNTAGTS